ncbi:MAG: transcriptional repressor [Chitinophagales bacterium]|nr:transcriptional repressor [Chitinophagales bacterium]MDW8419327.1 transcriptional repressor [Chitinophagales bacterium]
MSKKKPHPYLDEVKNIFSAYLEQKQLRKTNERFTILEEIYARNDHFDAESLYEYLVKKKKYNVSRATVYNTLDLLVSCDLVKKHQFGKNQAQYEKSYGYKQHDHIICVDCKKVVEFCDPRIQQIKTMMGEILNFKITHHSLNLYGVCRPCQMKREIEMRGKNQDGASGQHFEE